MEELIKAEINKALKELGLESVDFVVEHPAVSEVEKGRVNLRC